MLNKIKKLFADSCNPAYPKPIPSDEIVRIIKAAKDKPRREPTEFAKAIGKLWAEDKDLETFEK